jgi:hypothetical protein
VVCRDLIDADIDEGSSPALPDLSPSQWDLILTFPFQMATHKAQAKAAQVCSKVEPAAKAVRPPKQADCSEEDDE